MATPTRKALTKLVEPDRVHRRLYTDPDVFELEMERLFGRAWVYVGHESQVAEPGAYVTTRIGRQPVVMVRHDDASVRVLHNRCGHRGAQVVSARCGRARSFQCAYHGWTFATDGTLRAIPRQDGYDGSGLDMSDPQYGMRPVAAVECYRGFVFARLSGAGADLRTALGGALSSIDDMVDRSPTGELEIAGGCHRIVQRSNWKIFLENTHDGMHAPRGHRSSIDASRAVAEDLRRAGVNELPAALAIIAANGQSLDTMGKLAVTTFAGGHSHMGGFRKPRGDDAVQRDYEAALVARLGPERAEEVLSVNRHNAVFYPSATAQSPYLQFRVIFPLAVDRTLVEHWSFRLNGAPEAFHRRIVAYANTVHSPASIIRHDDVEVYSRVQRGLASEAADWVSHHREFGREQAGVSSALSDSSLRNQFAAWLDYMTA